MAMTNAEKGIEVQESEGSVINLANIETTAMVPDKSELDADLHVKTAQDQGRDLDDAVVRKLLWKIDVRLVTALGLLYTLCLIDRGNLPIARLEGLNADLGLSVGNRYSILTFMFFIPYILAEVPANVAIRKLGPTKWLGSIGFLWGVCTIGMGFCKTWGQLLVCRIFFGAFEAGLFPGAVFLMSCWYKRFEIQKRFAGFYALGLMCGGLSSLIGEAVLNLNHDRGYSAWRWLFIIEGSISCLVAILAFFLLVDFPDRAARPTMFSKRGFLTSEEASIVLARIARDRGDDIPEPFTGRNLIMAFKDWKIWEFSLLILCNNMVVYSFSLFLPLILKGGFGYSTSRTYVLTFPPYVVATVWMFIVAYCGDKYHIRGPLIAFNATITIIGISMMAFATKAPNARYAGVFLGLAPCAANIPTIFSYQHNNLVGQVKRAVATAMMVGGGGIGGVIAGNAFQQRDAPHYTPGLITAITLSGLTIIVVCKNFLYFTRQNRKADRGEILIEGQPGFRHTL